jgi:hypothetical protein
MKTCCSAKGGIPMGPPGCSRTSTDPVLASDWFPCSRWLHFSSLNLQNFVWEKCCKLLFSMQPRSDHLGSFSSENNATKRTLTPLVLVRIQVPQPLICLFILMAKSDPVSHFGAAAGCSPLIISREPGQLPAPLSQTDRALRPAEMYRQQMRTLCAKWC